MRRALPLCCLALLGAGSPPSALAAEAWYRGDLHAHSLHSDGDSLPADLVAVAEARGLDFFALTDHDSSMGGETPHWVDPGYTSDSITLLYGVEWTNVGGHANVWAAAPFDYTELWQANLAHDPWAAAEAAHAQGALFSINHPVMVEFCCEWQLDLGMSDGIEIWNGSHRLPSMDYTSTRRVWGDALAQGQRPTAVGGSDTHDLAFPLGVMFTVGDPTTWVLAASSSGQDIIAALASGRVSIANDPDAPRVELWADGDEDGRFETAMGEQLSAGTATLKVVLGADDRTRSQGATPLDGAAASAALALFEGGINPSALAQLKDQLPKAGCGPDYLVGLYEGERLKAVSRLSCGGGTWILQVDARSGSWYRVEVLGWPRVDPIQHPIFGLYIAASNPIYVQ